MMRRLAVALFLPVLVAGTTPDPASRLTALRLEPSAGRTELTVQLDGGQVSWSDFSLADPARVVVDISGARNELPTERYDDIRRGGIRGVRTSQYQPDVVRIVIDLDRSASYAVRKVPDGLAIAFTSTSGGFEPWSSGVGAARPTAATSTVSQTQPRQPVQVQQRRAARRITATFNDVDIRDVLASFAEFSGKSIVAGAGVTGNVSAEITDQPWDIALQTILRAYGFDAEELPSGIIRVDAIERLQQRAQAEPLVTQTFRVNYVPAKELVTTLEPMKTERGSIVANASTNTVIVTDVESVVNRVASMVQQLDLVTPQVAIEAKIIFVNRTDAQELGVSYDLKDFEITRGGTFLGNSLGGLVGSPDPEGGTNLVDRDIIALGGTSIAALGNAAGRVQDGNLATVISLALGRFSLTAFIDALQSSALADVQAAPLITTMDNQEAEIWVGERTPIRVVDVGQGGGAAPRATAQLVETGIILRVTPHVTADRKVLMQLYAERSGARAAGSEIGVIFDTQRGVTRLMVNDGETAVIGGLTVTDLIQSRSGIPFLMDIPFIGALFRTVKTSEQKRDLLIMVTPHIVDERAS